MTIHDLVEEETSGIPYINLLALLMRQKGILEYRLTQPEVDSFPGNLTIVVDDVDQSTLRIRLLTREEAEQAEREAYNL